MRPTASLVLVCLGLSIALDNVEGRRNKSVEQVINGLPASLSDFSVMAVIYVTYGNWDARKQYFCGGTILNQRYVMSAAHCLMREKHHTPEIFVPPKDVVVGVGCEQYNKCSWTSAVKKLIVHKPFGPRLKHDIALIKLAREIEFDRLNRNKIISSAIKLPFKVEGCPEETRSGRWFYPGYGRGPGESQGRLRVASVREVSFQACKRKFNFIDQASTICVAGSTKDASAGDGGSPLLSSTNLGQQEQFGIASRFLHYPGYPPGDSMAFTKVTNYLPWIWACIIESPDCARNGNIQESDESGAGAPISSEVTPVPPHNGDSQPDELRSEALVSAGGKTDEFVEQIIGGEQARPGELPFMVHIRTWSETEKRNYPCGGTILDSRHILTLATCVTTRKTIDSIVPISYVRLGIGCHLRSNCDYKSTTLEKIMVHQRFKAETSYDLAILRVSKEIEFNMDPAKGPLIAPISLSNNNCVTARTFEVAGWGLLVKGAADLAPWLMKARVKPVPSRKCNQRYPWMDFENHKCYGDAYQGTCRYDIGGPLFIRAGPLKFFQVGIIAEGVCTDDSGGIFQMIPNRYQWILKCLLAPNDQNSCPHVARTS